MTHDPGCPHVGDHTDAAKRCSDAVSLHLAALGLDAVSKWVAVRLADGGSDGTLYDRRRDAIRHQSDEKLCVYICVQPGGMNICRAESFMAFQRRLYESGFATLIDPDDVRDRQVIPRLTREQHARQMSTLR